MTEKIIFDQYTCTHLLKCFKKGIDTDGYIIDDETKKRLLASDGLEIRVDEVACIRGNPDGSIIIDRNDLPSLIELSDKLEDVI